MQTREKLSQLRSLHGRGGWAKAFPTAADKSQGDVVEHTRLRPTLRKVVSAMANLETTTTKLSWLGISVL